MSKVIFEKEGKKFEVRTISLLNPRRLELNIKEKGKTVTVNGVYSNITKNQKGIWFDDKIIHKGRKMNGVKLPEKAKLEIERIVEEKRKEIREEKLKHIKKLINGKTNINFKANYYESYYDPYVKDYPDNVFTSSDNFLEEAIEEAGESIVLDISLYFRNYINLKTNTEIKNAFNKEYKEGKLVSFDLKFKDCIDLEKLREKKEEREKKKKERNKLKNSIIFKLIEEGKYEGGDGVDYFATVRLTDKETKESLEFTVQNIFDFGYVINPNYPILEGLKKGGLEDNGKWTMYGDGEKTYKRDLTEFEKKCIEYLYVFSPLSTEIRL